jgi:hypothetical protein
MSSFKSLIAGYKIEQSEAVPAGTAAEQLKEAHHPAVTDVRAGKEVNMGSNNSVLYGAVVGRTRCVNDKIARKLSAQEAKKPKRRPSSKTEAAS